MLFAFGDADTNFGTAGRAVVGFPSTNHVPAIEDILLTSAGKITVGGTSGLARFTSAGAIDTTFGTSGKAALPAGTNFVAAAVDPSTGNIYELLSGGSGTGLIRYSANGKLDTTYGSGGIVTVTSSKTFTAQALAVQSDGKVIVAGIFKTDSSNGRKIRVYRLKTDGTSDTSFNSTGAIEFNFGQSSFLASTVFDQVAAVKIVSGGKIDIIGGTIDYTPASTDPDTGEFTDATYDKATFAVARLKTDGTLDSTYGSSGIARDDYATSDNINQNGIDSTLPHAAATRSDDSVLVGGLADTGVVAEFGPTGTVKYTTASDGAAQLSSPAGITTLSDGRSVLLAIPSDNANQGYAMVAIASDGTLGNVVFTNDNDGGTTDINDFDFSAGIVTNSNGELLVGGGDTDSNYVLEEIKAGNVSDARPDDFANARANDIVVDGDGGLHLAYFDAATTHMVYAHRNPNGVWDAPVVVDKGANAGQYVSIAVNSKGNPGIAYFDGTNGDLKLAQFNGTKWVLETVDSKGSVGLYPSFTYDNADEPVVTYYNKTKGKLTFALKNGTTGKWGYENVDSSADNVGRSSVLVASPNTGRYTVAYVDNTTGSVMWAGHQKGGVWQVKVAATTKGGADFLSMAYGESYQPMISYYDAFSADLKITSFFNNQFNVKTLATAGAQGLYTGAFFGDFFGSGQVFAYNRTQDKVTLFDGVENSVPTATDVVTAGGKYLSVAASGSETFLAYFDAATGSIKVRPGPTLSD